MGYAKYILTMFFKKILNRSDSTSVIVAEKIKGNYRKLYTVGIAKDVSEIEEFRKYLTLDG